jgi:hypothetical protein
MTTETERDVQPPGRSECWCCGRIEDQAKLVHLGNHPEVTVCTGCAHALSKWAGEIEDQARAGLPVRVRDQLRRARKTVIARGWHKNRFIGPAARWIGKHTP